MKFTLLTAVAIAALAPQQSQAMNWKNIALGTAGVLGTVSIIYNIYQYNVNQRNTIVMEDLRESIKELNEELNSEKKDISNKESVQENNESKKIKFFVTDVGHEQYEDFYNPGIIAIIAKTHNLPLYEKDFMELYNKEGIVRENLYPFVLKGYYECCKNKNNHYCCEAEEKEFYITQDIKDEHFVAIYTHGKFELGNYELDFSGYNGKPKTAKYMLDEYNRVANPVVELQYKLNKNKKPKEEKNQENLQQSNTMINQIKNNNSIIQEITHNTSDMNKDVEKMKQQVEEMKLMVNSLKNNNNNSEDNNENN